MAGGRSENKESALEWIGLAVALGGVLFGMTWFVASNYIVYYGTPIAKAIGMIWHLVPVYGEQAIADLQAASILYRRHAGNITLADWASLWNLAFRPWSFLAVGFVVWLIYSQNKAISRRRLNRRLRPTSLAKEMLHQFTAIAPVAAIQKELVDDALPGWRRQTFPHELLMAARINKKRVIKADNTIDPVLLSQYLTQYRWKKVKVNGKPQRMRVSKYLGRQIVDLALDTKDKKVVFPDRLSDPGKAVFAILAPYAFGGNDGKRQSKATLDALNMSAYGSKTGSANLAVPEAAQSFEAYRKHESVRKLAQQHHWEYTYLFALLDQARKNGKIGPEEFIWLKPMSRILFYVLDTHGRYTPHPQAGMAFAQVDFERRAMKAGRLPIIEVSPRDREEFDERGDYMPGFCVEPVRDAFTHEWETWLNGEEDDRALWADKDIWLSPNSSLFSKTTPSPPPAELSEDTAFDQAMRADQKRAEEAAQAVLEDELAHHTRPD